MIISTISEGLARIPAGTLDPPVTGRIGATLVLLHPRGDDVEILYTRRQPHLSSHPGQISFPGGRVDPGEGIVEAALREAREEVGLDTAGVTVLGRLPAFYIPPSRFWMSAVVAVWDDPHDLTPNPGEVAELLSVPIGTLREEARWRSVPLTAAGSTWAWQLAPQRLLWGATAVVTGVLLHVADPGWSAGVQPEDLPADRVVRPWEDPEAAGLGPAPAISRARLSDVVTEELSLQPLPGKAPDTDQVAGDVVHAVDRLIRRPAGPVVVLAGPGGTGRVAAAVAAILDRRGDAVLVVDPADPPRTEAFVDIVSGAGVIVDGFLGRGFTPPLREPVRGMVRALSATGAPIIAIDLPSGVDPVKGVVGDVVSADVTVAVAPVAHGHSAPGALPFLGDLYLSRAGRQIVRVRATDRPTVWAE